MKKNIIDDDLFGESLDLSSNMEDYGQTTTERTIRKSFRSNELR